MPRVEFRLTMPNKGSRSGKWSGDDRNYTIVKSLPDKTVKELGLSVDATKTWHYSWDDGWGANITARIMAKGERAKKSDGFCGYDWMVRNIILDDSPYWKPNSETGD